jgi:shikimate 5-dehydrogenase
MFILASAAALGLSGCAALSNAVSVAEDNPEAAKLTIQYGTMKLAAESSDGELLSHIERVEKVVNEEPDVIMDDLLDRVSESSFYQKLLPEDRLVMDAVAEAIKTAVLKKAGEGPLGEAGEVRLLTALGWMKNVLQTMPSEE